MKSLQIAKKGIVWILKILCRIFYAVVPVKDNSIVFMAYHGRGYLDNPKAVYEEMTKDPKFKDYQFYWILRHKNDCPSNAISVKYMSLHYLYIFARAKYWVVNCKLPQYIYKKKNQIYLQTWHGTPLKKLGHDIEVSADMKFYRSGLSQKEMLCTYDDDVAKYNYLISPNPFTTKVFPSAFHISPEKLIEVGYPRNDILSNQNVELIENIKRTLNLPFDKKVILYAPTWRDDSFVTKGYTFELKADFKKWKILLQDEYIVLFKPHYLIVNKIDSIQELDGFLYSIDADFDINYLYLVSDILITDYSSVFFDYAILNRPIYFYMYDRSNYQHQLRGFYLDVDKDLPGKVYENEDEMLEDVKDKKFDYQKLKEFNHEFNCFQDGQCSKKVIDTVFC